MMGSAQRVGRLVDAAADLAEVGAEHAQCRTCQCYRRPAEEALSILAAGVSGRVDRLVSPQGPRLARSGARLNGVQTLSPGRGGRQSA